MHKGAVVFFHSSMDWCGTTLVPQSPMGTHHGVHLILFTKDTGQIVVRKYYDSNLSQALESSSEVCEVQ